MGTRIVLEKKIVTTVFFFFLISHSGYESISLLVGQEKIAEIF